MKKSDKIKNKIRLMYIVFSVDTGGLEKLLIEMIKRLDRSVFEISVLCLTEKGDLADALKNLNIPVFYMNKKDGLKPYIIFKISKLLKDEKIDIVHTHDSSANFYGGLGAKLAGVNRIINTEHGGIYFESRRKRAFNKYLSRINEKQICVSDSIKNNLQKMGLPLKKLITIHNGVDAERFHVNFDAKNKRASLGINESDYVISTIGRLAKEKNQRFLIVAAPRILKRAPNAIFLIIGDGPEKEQISKEVARLGLEDKVLFLNNREDIPELLKITDCLVSCSDSESFGLAIVEAMLSKVPVIATDVGGVGEIVKNGETGILIEPNHDDALASAIQRFQEDNVYRKNIIEKAYLYAKKRFGLDRMVETYENVYRDISIG